VKITGWSAGLEVTADGEGIVSHAGLALLRALADSAGFGRNACQRGPAEGAECRRLAPKTTVE